MSNSRSRSSSESEEAPDPGFWNKKRQTLKGYFSAWSLATATSILSCVLIGLICARSAGYQWITFRKEMENESYNKRHGIKPDAMFSYHPLFMTIAMIFMQSQAAMMFRSLRHRKFSRFTIKLFHAGFEYGTFVLLVFGLQAAFVAYKINKTSGLDDAHGWLGIITVFFFTIQMVFGTLAFLFPGASPRIREWYVSYHRFFGAVLIMVSAVVVLMGMAMYQKKGWGLDAVMSKVYVLSVVVYAVAMAFTVANEEFIVKNSPTAEERRRIAAPADQIQYTPS